MRVRVALRVRVGVQIWVRVIRKGRRPAGRSARETTCSGRCSPVNSECFPVSDVLL